MDTFVGRTVELAVLAEAAEAARDGATTAVLVVGEPGSGKSRLLHEAARAPRLRRLHVVGYEPEQQIPFAAAVPLLRDLAAEREHGSLLEDLVFGRSEARNPLEPRRIFEAAHRALGDRPG